MSDTIQIHNLRKRFGDLEVVRGISLSVRPGICFGVLGPNGAGKTTTIKMILGLSPYNDGSIEIFGKPMPQKAAEIRQHVGVVPQVDNLDPDFTVYENLKIYGRYFSIDARALKKRIPELLDFVDLGEKADAKIQKLSGGMLRRLTIARALIHDPQLLILDEPTTGLDPQVRHALWSRMFSLKNQGKTLLLTTHYMEEAERLCDELVIMDQGRILTQGSPKELIKTHAPGDVVEIRNFEHTSLESELPDIPGISRIEKTADQLICQCSDSRALMERIHIDSEMIVMHRPSNLEDVFLSLTGRDLKET